MLLNRVATGQGKGVKNIPHREKSGNLKILLKSRNSFENGQISSTICKVVESFDELFFYLKDFWWLLVVAHLY